MTFRTTHSAARGFSLIDTIIGIALMTIVFFALFGAFRFSLILLGIAKAKISAIALANEQMEYIRSIDYDSVGTVSGIPAGAIPQIENFTYNNIAYTRRVLVQYEDAPQDGLGAADSNSLTADYKRIKVTVSWTARGRAFEYSLISTMVPRGVESVAGGGTLRIYALSALGAPLDDATVRIQNPSTTPAIDVTVNTNSAGKVEFPGGTPAASGYQITVSKSGYSTAKTYSVTAANPSPSPGHLTVVAGGTTSSTFSIDQTATNTIRTFIPLQAGSFSDSFPNSAQTSLLASTTVAGGEVDLVIDPDTSDYAPQGEVRSTTVNPSYLYSWESFSWTDDRPAGTDIRYRVYYDTGSGYALVPDSALPGNALGATTSPIVLTTLATTTYPRLRLSATLAASVGSTTPSVHDWDLSYKGGPTPLPNIAFTLQGAKTIGTNGVGTPIYKYSQSLNTGASSVVAVPGLEWDNYTITLSGGTYDIAESCKPQPVGVTPGSMITTDLTLAAHTTNSLLVAVRDNAGALASGATVRLYGGATDITKTSSECGQAFFSSLSSSLPYTLEVSKSGFQTTTITPVNVGGNQSMSATINP